MLVIYCEDEVRLQNCNKETCCCECSKKDCVNRCNKKLVDECTKFNDETL